MSRHVVTFTTNVELTAPIPSPCFNIEANSVRTNCFMSTKDVAGRKMSTTHVIDPTGLWYRVVPLGSSAHGMSNYFTRCVQKEYAQGLIVAWTLSYFMNTCNLTSE